MKLLERLPMKSFAAGLALAGAAAAGFGASNFLGVFAATAYFGPTASEMYSVADRLQLNGLSSIVLTKVPANRFLVITDALWEDQSLGNSIDLVQRDPTGNEVTKIVGTAAAISWGSNATSTGFRVVGHGVVFGPGTEVVLKNLTGSNLSLKVQLVGYYADR